MAEPPIKTMARKVKQTAVLIISFVPRALRAWRTGSARPQSCRPERADRRRSGPGPPQLEVIRAIMLEGSPFNQLTTIRGD